VNYTSSATNGPVIEVSGDDHLDNVVLDVLRALLPVMAPLYALFAFAHVFMLPSSAAWVMTPVAAATALSCWGASRSLRTRQLPRSLSPHGAAAVFAGLVFLNSWLHLVLLSDPKQAVNIVLLIIGCGCLFLRRRWLIGFIAVAWIGWGIAVIRSADGLDWSHYSFSLLAAAALSYAVQNGRRGTHRELYGVRVDDQRTKAKLARDLHYSEYHDELTGLPNRKLLLARLGEALVQNASNPELSFGVLFVDLDGFKRINDNLGHSIGDELLVKVAQRLYQLKRPGDTVARLRGDEFIFLLNGCENEERALSEARRIATVFAESICVHGREVLISAGIGAAFFSDDPQTPESLLQKADLAMYEAKSIGSGTIALFSHGMEQDSMRRWTLENDLRYAMERGQFFLVYQPRVAVATGRIEGVEGLLRWRSSSGELISPLEFIPLAEGSGLIHKLGLWVLEEACRQTGVWKAAGLPPLQVSVNTSPDQLRDPAFASQAIEALQRSGVGAGEIELEITESAFIDESSVVFANLAALAEHRIQLAIDDFGTGYSALQHLNRFQFSVLKIDKSMLDEVPDSPQAASLASGVIELAKRMKLVVVAEGVEKPAQLRFLKEQSCDYVQGFLTGKPVLPEEIIELLKCSDNFGPLWSSSATV